MRALAVVLILAAVIFTPSVSGASFPGGITFTAVREKAHNYQRAPQGRVGDLVVSDWRLNDRYGRSIGYANFACRWVTAVARICYGEYRLARGSVILGGSAQTVFNADFAVLGGTGFYAGIKGVAKHTGIGNRRASVVIYIV